MAGFHRRQEELWCDEVPLRAIAAGAGTPVHVYSAALFRERYTTLDRAFRSYPHRIHYAIKANSTTAVVRELGSLGAGVDANSGGELEVALAAGIPATDIVFTGVGKTSAELRRAIGLGVAAINAESPGEVQRIAAIADELGTTANVAVRINPGVEAGSHPHISTGHHGTKFGMTIEAARAMLADMSARPSLRIVGLHVHVGSQITTAAPIGAAVRAIAGLARELSVRGVALRHLDVGGGLGIAYGAGDVVVTVEDYAAAVLEAVEGSGIALLLEPGRWIVGPAGVIVTEVVDMKARNASGSFVVVDAGMTELIRPALYGAWHEIEPVLSRAGPPILADIVGPVCETSDTLGTDRPLPPVEVGDLLAIRDTGAYGAVMASNYNRRPAAAEVLVDGDRWRVVRRRQTVADLLQWDE